MNYTNNNKHISEHNNKHTSERKSGLIDMKMNLNPKNDQEYLTDMIAHHQIAVDMTQNFLHVTNNPALLALGNDIIRTQNYEIWLMKQWLKNCNYSEQSQICNVEYQD